MSEPRSGGAAPADKDGDYRLPTDVYPKVRGYPTPCMAFTDNVALRRRHQDQPPHLSSHLFRRSAHSHRRKVRHVETRL